MFRARHTWVALAVFILATPVAVLPAAQWSSPFPAAGFNDTIYALAVYDEDASGPNPPALYAGGAFTMAGGVPADRIAKWNGSSWSEVGGGTSGTVFTLTVYDDDANGPHLPALYAGGAFLVVGGTINARGIAKWTSTGWSMLGVGTSDTVYATTVFTDPNTPNNPGLYVGGLFTTAGGTLVNRIAKWNGAAWSPLGEGVNSYVNALAGFDPDGTGPLPPALYVGGGFTTAGSVTASRIAKWDGLAWWPLTMGLYEGLNNKVYDMAVFTPPGGQAGLYVGGYFTTAANTPAAYIARWTGSAWTTLGTGMDAPVRTLYVFDEDDSGPGTPALYAGGLFTTAGGSPASRIARWSGTAWSALGTGISDYANDMAAFDDDGAGSLPPAMFVGGEFLTAGGLPAVRAARWGSTGAPPPPVIEEHPVNQTVYAGGRAVFSVKAGGTGPFTYRWRKNTVDVPGAVSDTLVIDPAAVGDAGSYDCVVTNGGGSTTSNAAALTVVTIMRGDADCDLHVGFSDIDYFVAAIPNRETAWRTLYETRHGGTSPICPFANCDVNANGNVGFDDIDPFVDLIGKQ